MIDNVTGDVPVRPYGRRGRSLMCNMDLCNQSCQSSRTPDGRPSILLGTNVNIKHYEQTYQLNSVTPAMLIGTIDYYHFTPLSVTLSLAGGFKVKAKQNLLASFFCTLFNTWVWTIDMALKQFILNVLVLILSETWWFDGNNRCFIICVRTV